MNPFLFVDVDIKSDESWGAFEITHGITHQTTYQAILALDKVPVYLPLFDFPREDNQNYLLDHWEVHRSNASALGLASIVDLSTVDLSNPQQYLEWMQLHSQVHLNEQAALAL